MATLDNFQIAAIIERLGGDLNFKRFCKASGVPYPLIVKALKWLDAQHLTIRKRRRMWVIDWHDALEIIRDTPIVFDNGKKPPRNFGYHVADDEKHGSRVVFIDEPLGGLSISLTLFIREYQSGWLTADEDPLRVRYVPRHGPVVECVLMDDGLYRNGERFYV